MSDSGICFFSHGTKHLARLVVAIHSLRKHYSGPICLLETGEPEAEHAVASITVDDSLGVNLKRFEMPKLRRNSCYVAKASLWRHSPFNRTLLCDADVLFRKSPEPLFAELDQPSAGGFVVTRFSDWRTCGKIISSRLEKWRGVKCDGIDCDKIVEYLQHEHWPAINTGVLAWDREVACETLELWERLTLAGWRNPWTDELAAQIVIAKRKHFAASEIYNSSVLYGRDDLGAVVKHYHGSKMLRPEDAGVWIAAYRECCNLGIGGVGEWGAATDSRLAGLS